jgi:hypothetical protein
MHHLIISFKNIYLNAILTANLHTIVNTRLLVIFKRFVISLKSIIYVLLITFFEYL